MMMLVYNNWLQHIYFKIWVFTFLYMSSGVYVDILLGIMSRNVIFVELGMDEL